jgi:hypothetical protein
MLGTVGFSAAALIFAAYAATSSGLGKKAGRFDIQSYVWAYGMAVLAFVSWGVATLLDEGLLLPAVLVGDIFIMASSVLLLRIQLPDKNRNLYLFVAIVLFGAALAYRALSEPGPVMRDSVLAFNTPPLFAALLAVVLLAVWVRSNLRFYSQVVQRAMPLPVLRTSYVTSNVMAFIGICGFLFARKWETTVLSFSMVVLAFATLTALNHVAKQSAQKGVSHAG